MLTRTIAAGLLAATALMPVASHAAPISVSLNGSTFTNQGLVGVGRLPANTLDIYGETFGSLSSLSFDFDSWKRTGDTYSGRFFAQPDRGFNVVGTTNYIPRVNVIDMTFTPFYGAGVVPQNQVAMTLSNSIRYHEATGTPLTSLDPKPGNGGTPGTRTLFGVDLPAAFNDRISLDGEGIVRLADGSFFVSDEYGPNIYRFDKSGTLIGAIVPPEALTPIRNGVPDFSSNNPATGQPAPSPANPTQGRVNNQGMEGLSLSPDGRTLVGILQSATVQDGNTGGSSATRDNTRLFTWDVSDPDNPELTGHYVVQLPKFTLGSGATRVAAQSEILALNDTQFLLLSRDGNGFGTSTATSLYRQVDLLDISAATNLVTTNPIQVAPGGVLDAEIDPATLVPFININDLTELAKFGLRNGAPNDVNNLSEKWEALGLVPALDPDHPNDYFLFVGNDNDFLTTDGFQDGAAYDAGLDNPTTLLVFRLTLPTALVGKVPEPSSAALLGAALIGVLVIRRRRDTGASTAA